MPVWVSDTQLDDAYYHAIVTVPKYDSRYKDQAFEKAVQNISMQINVNVDASVSTKETEAFGISKSDFESNIKTSSRTRLKNVELLRAEENKHGYWAHYRLNKHQYTLQRLQQAELGKRLALDLIQKYDQSLKEQSFEFMKSSLYLIKALDELSDLLDVDLNAQLYGYEVNLYTEALHRLSTLAAKTKLSLEPNQIATIMGSRLNLKSDVKCLYEGKPNLDLVGLRLKAAFSKGSGSLLTNIDSNPLGVAQLEIQSIKSADKNQSITIEVDKKPLLEQSDNPLVKKMISSLNFSSVSLPLAVRCPRVWVDYSHNGSSSECKQLLDNRLSELSVEVVDDKRDADYQLIVDLKSEAGGQITHLGIFSAFCDATISLRNAQTQEVLSSETIKGIKATAPSRAKAVQAVEPEALRVVNQEVIYRLVKSHILP